MKKGIRITVFLVVAGGAFAWRILGIQSESGAAPPEPHPEATPAELEHAVRVPSTQGERTALLPHPGQAQEAEPTSAGIIPAQPLPRSPLARDLHDVAASFLTELPRVTDVLGLVERLASLAVVDSDSVTVQRGQAGDLKFARGPLAIDDLAGTFLIDQDGYCVDFDIPLADGSWSRCGLHIAFQEGESGAGACYATVQFHRKENEVAPSDRGDVLIGWAVGTSREKGSLASPLMMRVDGDSWQIGDSGRLQPQEFPWATSYIAGFDAWLRLLKAYTSR